MFACRFTSTPGFGRFRWDWVIGLRTISTKVQSQTSPWGRGEGRLETLLCFAHTRDTLENIRNIAIRKAGVFSESKLLQYSPLHSAHVAGNKASISRIIRIASD